MELFLIVLFTVSGALIVYHHVGYPLFLSWYSRNHPRRPLATPTRGYRNGKADRTRPSITIVVPAYNEERWIAEKIRNLAALDYPRDKLNIIIACDGCTDKTVEFAQDTIQEAVCSDTFFEIRSYKDNVGKVELINTVMVAVSSDITALSDVSAVISIDALLVAEQHFKDPNAGAVNGHYQMMANREACETTYWNYQSRIKQEEATLGSTLGAHGAFYLFRTHLFQAFETNTINDDFILPMKIVRQGYRVDYDQNMVSLELEPTSTQDDFKRRLRISAGNMQQAIQLADLFSPKYHGVAFAFISGKGLRLVTPYLMLLCLCCSIALADNTLFLAALVAQISVYTLGALTIMLPRFFNHKLCQLVAYVLFGHYANFVGGLRYLLGLESGRWTRINH